MSHASANRAAREFARTVRIPGKRIVALPVAGAVWVVAIPRDWSLSDYCAEATHAHGIPAQATEIACFPSRLP